MSWTDEELDDLVRNASKQVPNPIYQDEYFDEIVNLLPKKKKNKRWLLLFIPFVFLPFLFHQKDSFDKEVKSREHNKSLVDQKSENEEAKPNNVLSVSNDNPAENRKIVNVLKSSYKEFDSQMNEFSFIEVFQAINSNENNIEKEEEQQFVNTLQLKHLTISDNLELNRSPFLMHQTKVKNWFFVNGGLGFSESFMAGSAVKPSLKLDLGVGYQRLFKSFEGEIGFNIMSLLPQKMNLSKSSKVYGVKINRYQQIINYRAIFALEIPIQIYKKFNKSKFSVGISPQYYLGSRLVVSQSTNGESVDKTTYFMNKFGLSSFAMKFNVSYLYRLTKKLEFGVNLSVISNNPLDEVQLTVHKNNLPFSGQVTLRKYFTLR